MFITKIKCHPTHHTDLGITCLHILASGCIISWAGWGGILCLTSCWCPWQEAKPFDERMGFFQAEEPKKQARARWDSTACPGNIQWLSVQLCPKHKSRKWKLQIKTGKLSISAQLCNRQSSLLPQSLDYRPGFFPSPPSAIFLPFQVFSNTNIYIELYFWEVSCHKEVKKEGKEKDRTNV